MVYAVPAPTYQQTLNTFKDTLRQVIAHTDFDALAIKARTLVNPKDKTKGMEL